MKLGEACKGARPSKGCYCDGSRKGIDLKRAGELEDVEAKEDRKIKRKHGKNSKETAVTTE